MTQEQRIAAIKEAAAQYFGGLDASAEASDLTQEAWLQMAENPEMDAAAAVKAARAKLRKPRATINGKQQSITMAYLGAKVGDADGLTFGETIAADPRPWLNGLTAEQRALAEKWIAEGTLGEQVAAARIKAAAAAHGAEMAARGAANAERGALNDQRLLEIVKRCGGRGSYGLAGKVQQILRDEHGVSMEKLTINKAIQRAYDRTEGTDPHSSRD